MKKIKFTHRYRKLGKPGHGVVESGDKAMLLQVFELSRRELSPAMVNADTVYGDAAHPGYYPLPSGKLLFLLFLSESGHMFPTIRSARTWPYDKAAYYRDAIGEMFEVVIGEVSNAQQGGKDGVR